MEWITRFWSRFGGNTTLAAAPEVTAAAAVPEVRAVAKATIGHPHYASGLGITSALRREISFELLGQLYRNVPVMQRTTDILAGFVGCPRLVVDGNDGATEELNAWASTVEYGHGVGSGLEPWMRDQLTQSLLYGYAVGEVDANGRQGRVERLWSYASPGFNFEADGGGRWQLVQYSGGVKRTLNPETALTTTHNPIGCNPVGQSLFAAVPLYAQAFVNLIHAQKATILRTGVPVFHVNWQPPDTLNDPEGTISAAVVADLETKVNEAIRSQAIDGIPKDIYTSGKITITTVGADGEALDFQINARTLCEQIVVLSGIPPMLFGFAWSTTERMSKQQADALVSTIGAIRRELESPIRKIVAIRQRVAGLRPGVLRFEWPAVNLQDEKEAAAAEALRQQALLLKQRFARQAWADGILSQRQVAEMLTGSPQVAAFTSEPVPLDQGELPGEGARLWDNGSEVWDVEFRKAIAAEAEDAYDMKHFPGAVGHKCGANGNGRHSC